MGKILIVVENNSITFSTYTKKVDEQNLNNTNVIDTKNIIFTDEYIISNKALISMFLNVIVIKNNINKVVIKNIKIAEMILILIKEINGLNSLYFSEDIEVSYYVSSLLLKSKNYTLINCYSMPLFMYERFTNGIVELRSEIFFTSNFMEYNNINTFSKLYNKDKIIIKDEINKDDLNDLFDFLRLTKNLKKIDFKGYNHQMFLLIIEQLERQNFKNVIITIYENSDCTDVIFKDINLFDKLSKKEHIKIKINYSKEYKEKNGLKQLNNNFVRILSSIIFILTIAVFSTYKLFQYNDSKNLEDNMNDIQDIIDKNNENDEDNLVVENENETIEATIIGGTGGNKTQYVSSYYKKYSKLFNELLEVNNDTVGWVTVNNTRINYPVVQSADNNYYLNHAFDKTRNEIGWLFVDYRNNLDIIDKNTIIYGHNILNGNLMFSNLEKTIKPNWYNNTDNQLITFNIKEKNIKWKIFSIYTLPTTSDYLKTNFNSDESFLNFINMVKSRSINNFGVEINKNDKILTLSTCYRDADHRAVVHAKMVE
ncbi:MAG: class B sortase [Bacilli bacterium]